MFLRRITQRRHGQTYTYYALAETFRTATGNARQLPPGWQPSGIAAESKPRNQGYLSCLIRMRMPGSLRSLLGAGLIRKS